jgi:HIRAN domain
MEFRVVGVTFHDLPTVIGNLEPETPVYIEAEPTNQYDPHAIRVIDDQEHHLGYIAKEKTHKLRSLVKRGRVQCTSHDEGMHKDRPWMTIMIDLAQ